MHISKALTPMTVLATTTLLTACGGTHSVRVTGGCQAGTGGVTCRSEVEYKYVWKNTGYSVSSFDANNVRVELDQSNVNFTNSSGTMTLKIKSGSSTVATTGVSWHRVGSTLFPSNPGAVNAWVHANADLGDTMEYEIDNLEWAPHAGTNVVTAVVEYGSHAPAGDSDAIFMAPNELLGL